MKSTVEHSLKEHLRILDQVRREMVEEIATVAQRLADVLASGGKVLICGNGGSAADAQHFAAELIGRFERERKGLSALALTTDTSALTAIGNDYGFEHLFERQVEALANSADALIGISTSGASKNVLLALASARELGCTTIGLTGRDGGQVAALVDHCLAVPSERTARIQEAHLTLLHILCELIDEELEGRCP